MKTGALKLATAACVLICLIGTGLSAVGSLVGAFLPFLVSLPIFVGLLLGFWNSSSQRLNSQLCLLTITTVAVTAFSIPILNRL